MRNNRKMFFFVEHSVHVQHAQHTATCIRNVSAEQHVFKLTVFLLYFCYNLACIIYLDYCRMVYMGTAYRQQVGSAWDSVDLCQLVHLKVASHYLFLLIKYIF